MLSNKTNLTLAVLIIVFLVGCATQPLISPQQKRQITTRIFEAKYENTYRSILTVLQDQGYIVKNTDMNTGLINATVDRQTGTGAQVAQAILFGRVVNKGSELDVSFMVNKINETSTEIRINIQESSYGQTSMYSGTSKQDVKQILDPKIYDALFKEINTEIKRREAVGNE